MGPRVEGIILVKRVKMQGFILSDFAPQFGEAVKDLLAWFQAGKIKDKFTVREGLENGPETFIGMLKGENIGKMLIKVSD